MNTADLTKLSLDEIYEAFGYAVARGEADRRKVIWFASVGTGTVQRIKAEMSAAGRESVLGTRSLLAVSGSPRPQKIQSTMNRMTMVVAAATNTE
jgi:hypothetical protein